MRESLLKKYSFLWMVIPVLVVYGLFIVYPFFSSLALSFYSWQGIGERQFVGFENYRSLFVGAISREFYPAISHNTLFFLLSTLLNLSIGFLLALPLSQKIKGDAFFKTLFFIPNTLSIVVVGFLWSLLLHPKWGAVNQTLNTLNLSFLAKAWLGDPSVALGTVIAVSSWRAMGFFILTLLAAILGVDTQSLEAAKIDGASGRKIVFSIILPQVVPTLLTLTIMNFIWSFNVFDIVFAMAGTTGSPAGATDVLGTMMYRFSFGGVGSSYIDFGIGAAIATTIFIIVIPFSILYIFNVERERTR